MSQDTQEFRADAVLRGAWAAVRRYGWLMLLVVLAQAGVGLGARLLDAEWGFLGTDSEIRLIGLWLAERAAAALAAAVVFVLTLAGARGEPLRPPDALRRIAGALPVLALAEAVYSLPGAVAQVVFQGSPAVLGFMQFCFGLYHLALMLTLGLVVPAVLDRGLSLSKAIERSLALTRGRRWPLFVTAMAPLLAMGVVRYLLVVQDVLGLGPSPYAYIPNYPIYGLLLVVLAAVYVDADHLAGDGPRVAEAFD